MVSENIFQVKQAAEILGIPRSRLINWMSGRTVRFESLFRKSPGQGSPTMFSQDDLYRFAITTKLLSASLPGPLVQEAIDSAAENWGQKRLLVIFWTAKPTVKWTNSLNKKAVSQFVLNVGELRKEIDRKIEAYKGR